MNTMKNFNTLETAILDTFLTPSEEILLEKGDYENLDNISSRTSRKTRSRAETRKKSFYAEQRKKNIAREWYSNLYVSDSGVLHRSHQSDNLQFWKKVDRRDLRHASKQELNSQVNEFYCDFDEAV